jgi:hypothetical protein
MTTLTPTHHALPATLHARFGVAAHHAPLNPEAKEARNEGRNSQTSRRPPNFSKAVAFGAGFALMELLVMKPLVTVVKELSQLAKRLHLAYTLAPTLSEPTTATQKPKKDLRQFRHLLVRDVSTIGLSLLPLALLGLGIKAMSHHKVSPSTPSPV